MRLGPLTFNWSCMGSQLGTYYHTSIWQPGNAMLTGTSFMCSLLGRYHTGSIILQWVS